MPNSARTRGISRKLERKSIEVRTLSSHEVLMLEKALSMALTHNWIEHKEGQPLLDDIMKSLKVRLVF